MESAAYRWLELGSPFRIGFDQHGLRGVHLITRGACTLVLGYVPLRKICVTPRASLGFHQAYLDQRWTMGVKVASAEGTADLMRHYPPAVKDWIKRNGGLTLQMKHVKNGKELWAMIDPCPEEF